MGKKKATKKVKNEPEIQPAPKRQRLSLDDDDDEIEIVGIQPGEPIELDNSNSDNSDNFEQQARNMSDDDVNVVFMREEDIPGPSHAFHFGNQDENADRKAFAQINREFSERRQEIMTNLQSSLTEMEDDYNQIARLTETLHYDRQTKTKVKQESDELAAEIALKSAQKDILDKNLEEVSKRIETNEKTLETAENRIKSFEVNYKKEEEKAANPEPAGKVGEYECPICKEICGNEQKHMVCISNCGHRFCKDCIDRVLAPNEHEGLAGRRGARFLRIQQRLLDEAQLQRRMHGRPFANRVAGIEQRLRDREDHMGIRMMDEVAPARGENDNAAANVDAANPAAANPADFDRFMMIPDNQPIPVIRANEDGAWPPVGGHPFPWERRARNEYVQRRCPTCQKHFSKKHVIRLY